jgi:hypothetical protein
MDNILQSFEIKTHLTPDLWQQDKYLKKDIKDRLLLIAEDFYKTLEIDINYEDIIIVGSIANYNWSEFSDIDIHIIVDLSKVDCDFNIINELVKVKARKWSDEHNINIKGYDIEIYVQDISESNESEAVYSLIKNEWVEKPIKKNIKLNNDIIVRKYNKLIKKINSILKEKNHIKLKSFIDILRQNRKESLEIKGEYSLDNILYKILRRKGVLDILWDKVTEFYDRKMSL